VQQRSGQFTVSGNGAVLNAVTALLAGRGITARELRVDQASLEDAFVALTGRRKDEEITRAKEKAMSADLTTLPAAPQAPAAALRRLARTELALVLRERAGVIWGIGLPLVLLVNFGNIPGFRKPVSRATPGVSVLGSYVPVLLAFVLAMIALNVLPPVLAGYREKGVLRRPAPQSRP
jgi:hypothetical protein